MGLACTRFSTPVTGGNVSFYNQSVINKEEVPVFPTPTIGMIGILEDRNKLMTLDFKNQGDSIFLIGKSVNDIGCSEYLYSLHNVKHSPAPYFNLDEEFNVQQLVRNLIDKKLVNAVHDVSDGGLFITLMESALAGNMGFNIQTDVEIRKDAFLFGEAQGRIVVTVSQDALDDFIDVLAASDTEFTNLGVTGGDSMIIDDENFGTLVAFRDVYENAIGKEMIANN
jgi:phosphoribosylformylglycinamidine synthase